MLASARALLVRYQSEVEFYLTIERTIAASPAIHARKLEMSARLAEQVASIRRQRQQGNDDNEWQTELLPEIVLATPRVVLGK